MATPWQPLANGEVAVVHLSDPHFSERNSSEEVWKLVRQFIEEVRPELILATGDLADRPSKDLYERAKEHLDNFGVSYRVCPGNHDRFFKGNRLALEALFRAWPVARWAASGVAVVLGLVLGAFASPLWFLLFLVPAAALLPPALLRLWEKHTAALFDQVFAGKIALPGEAHPLKVGTGPAGWTVGVLGVDSSTRADWFARGYVPQDQFAHITQATAGGDWDVCVFLVHHHVLSVRKLEESRENRRADLFNLTCLVNAGRLLEALTAANVDLVLHGHEHAPNWGTYGSFEAHGNQVRVVAAGSATGNDSLKGCSSERATLNVLIFAPDRSVRMRRVAWAGKGWAVEDEFPLFDAAHLRHSWLRRTGLRGEINSEVVKHVRFTWERDIVVRWVYTNWWPPVHCEQEVVNSTGAILPTPTVRLTGPDGHQVAAADVGVRKTPGKDHSYLIRWTVPPSLLQKPVTMELEYRWQSGAILTPEEMASIQDRGPGPLRNEGLEFATLWTNGAVAAAELVVALPPEYAPADNELRVRVEEDGTVLEHEMGELRGRLRVVADGRYVLRIPFPRKNRHYQIAWPPTVRPHRDPAAEQFRQAARAHGPALLEAFTAALAPGPFRDRARLALYVLTADPSQAERVAAATPGAAHGDRGPPPPATVRLPWWGRSCLSLAWWGVPTVAARPAEGAKADELGMLRDEVALVCVPLRFAVGWTNPPPWGVVRVGAREGVDVPALFADNKTMLWGLLTPAVTALLTAALQGVRIQP